MTNMAVLRGRRVALLTNIPRPYRMPLYAALNQRIVEAGGELRVFYYSDLRRHARRRGSYIVEENFSSELIDGVEFSLGFERIVSLPSGMGSQLGRFDPHVLVCGSFGMPGYLGWWYTRLHHSAYIQWSGAWEGAVPFTESKRYRLHQGFLARQARACVTYGSLASEYLSSLGVHEECIVTGVNAVDVRYFQEQAPLRAVDAAQIRQQHGLHGVNILFVGNLSERKGARQLLEAFARLPAASGAALHFVGNGPLEAELRPQAQALGLQEQVFFWGQQSPQDMPLYYALADVFVFPSVYEPWGLVLNEAMACGLPIIASPLAGATRDLVQDGVNGFVVDPRNLAVLADALKRLIADPGLRQRMGEQARRTIEQKATIEHSAQAFIRAIEFALNPPTK